MEKHQQKQSAAKIRALEAENAERLSMGAQLLQG